MAGGNRDHIVKNIEAIPKLKSQVCKLVKEVEDLSFVSSIDSLDLNPTTYLLTLNYTDREGNALNTDIDLSPLIVTVEFKPDIVVDNFNDLSAVTGQTLYEFAEVVNSQGTSWLPGTLGGTYYGSGLYYWNGTEWIHDDDKVYSALQDFTISITNLETNLTQEISDRITEDTNLQNQINTNITEISNLENDLNQETIDRTNGDTTLQQNIDQEEQDRINADNNLQTTIDQQIIASQNADTILQQNIDAEALTRLNADNTLQSNIDAEEAARQAADTSLAAQIQSNDTDITALQNDKRETTAQKNSIEDDAGDLQLVGDQDTPGPEKVYGTNSAGVKGWYDQAGGDQAFVNESVLYKAFSDVTPGINNSFAFTTLFYKTAPLGTYNNTAFAPVANGVQLLVDLENLTIIASVYITSNAARTKLGVAIAIDGTPSTVEGTNYVRAATGDNEGDFKVIETFPSLPAGTVITAQSRRIAAASNNTTSVEDKGILSIFGFIPDSPGVVLGFPTPIITTISTT